MKVILAGFSKCGTKTMESAFKELGYNNYDFIENYQFLGSQWMKIFKTGGTTEDFRRMFKGVDSVTDLPCCFFWEEIHQAYPEAKIVLTERDNEDIWYDSFLRQLTSGDKLIYRIIEILSPTNYGMMLFIQRMFLCVCGYNFNLPWFGSHKSNELLLRMTYRKHNTYVKEKAPKDQLLLFNLKDGWKPLCEFLNEPIPDKPFPHKNKNASLGDEMMAVNPLFIRMQREAMFSLSLIGIAGSYFAYKFASLSRDEGLAKIALKYLRGDVKSKVDFIEAPVSVAEHFSSTKEKQSPAEYRFLFIAGINYFVMFNPLLWVSVETWLLLATIILLLWVYVRRKLTVLERLNIPSLEPGFLGLSAIRRLMTNPEYVLFKAGLENRKKYGNVYGQYMFLTPVVTIWDPAVLKQVYIKEFSIFPDRQKKMLNIQGEMNDSLLLISGPQWKRVRTTLTPTFSSAKLKEMLVIVQNCGDKLVETLRNIEDKKDGIFDSKITLGRFTMDVICAAAFGGDFHVQEGDEEPDTAKIMRETIEKPMMKNPVVILSLIFGSWFEKLVELMDYSVLGQKFRDHVNGILNAVIAEQHRTKRTDLMHLMLKNEISEKDAKTATKGLTRREIFGNSQLMIFAGYETTSTALMFLLYNLAIHQDCQEELREELQLAMDRHGGELSYETINDIKYLNMCINESLRLYPPTPMNQRYCEKDITIHGHHFVEGLSLRINVYAMAHDEEYWEDPYSFKPERMEDMSKIDPMIFQPFGAGPRNCIGMRFALMVLKLAICKILINFELLPTEDTPPAPCELKFGSTVSTKEKIVLKVKSL